MAVFAGDTAIVSLGISCQTAMQMSEHAALFDRHFLGKATHASTPLDWLLTGQTALARMLEQDLYFPVDDDELGRNVRPFWRRMNVYYFHEPMILVQPGEVRAKFDHMTRTLAKARDCARRVFIISNSQNNLPAQDEMIGERWWFLDDDGLRGVRAAVEARFGPSELYVVSYRGRHAVERAADRLFELEPDASNVRGDASQWAQVFEAVLEAGPAVPA